MIFTSKSFTFSAMIFTIILFGLYSHVIINHKMLYMNVEYAMWHYARDMSHSRGDEHYNFITLGDSRIKSAFIPQEFDDENLNSLNLSLGGSSTIEGYYTLKKYLENHEAPEYVLLGYSPGILSQQPFYWERTVKFQYLTDEEYNEVESLSATLDNHETLGDGNYLDYKIYTGKFITDFINGMTEFRWTANALMFEDLHVSKGHYYFGTNEGATGRSFEATVDDFQLSKLLDKYIEMTISMAQEAGTTVYWYTPPVNTASIDLITPEYKKGYGDYMDKLEQEHGVIVLSRIHDVENKHFSDSHHLYRGAPMVTHAIKAAFLAAQK